MPENVSFIPVDLEEVTLATALPHAGLDVGAQSFFSMLGVSQYLTNASLEQTLQFVLSMPSGCEIVFSFVASDGVLPAEDLALTKVIIERFAAIGEPWLSRFDPED